MRSQSTRLIRHTCRDFTLLYDILSCDMYRVSFKGSLDGVIPEEGGEEFIAMLVGKAGSFVKEVLIY